MRWGRSPAMIGREARRRSREVVGGESSEVIEMARELDGLDADVDARVTAAERDLVALEGASDAEALQAALAEFVGVWGALDRDEWARMLALVLGEIVVDGATGQAELRFRGARA